MDWFVISALVVGVGMMIWDCIEVGRNDATNIINSVFGSRILSRRNAVWLAGLAVILGATFASPVMETARKGIFDPNMLDIKSALAVYVSVYLVDTVLLYSLSSFGIPISTTTSLIFELIGGAIGVFGGLGIVHWEKVSEVIMAIVMSIIFTGFAGFFIQRIFRGAVGQKWDDERTLLIHGPWISGLILTWLSWFMIMKGMEDVFFIEYLQKNVFDVFGVPGTLIFLWSVFTLIIHLALTIFHKKFPPNLFKLTAVIGMMCMGFSFGQNDLANGAAPGLSILWLYQHSKESIEIANKIPIPMYFLFGCGALLVFGMMTKRAHRVTRAEVNTGSQYEQVALYAPNWCQSIARLFGQNNVVEDFSPPSEKTDEGKKLHYDPLRASVITSVGASVIAFASSYGYPVSTTYVAFAAVVATGWGDMVYSHGDSAIKIARSIWVVFCWFFTCLVATIATAAVGYSIINLGTAGIFLMLLVNLATRYYFQKKSDDHEKIYHKSTDKQIV